MITTRSEKKTLALPVTGKYFEQIKAGTKLEEYRLRNDHWRTRLEGRSFDSLLITHGYPSSADISKRLQLPWRGCEVKTITHEHFGPDPVEVYAIRLTQTSQPVENGPKAGRVYLVGVEDGMREERCFSMRRDDGWSICVASAIHAAQCSARSVRHITRVIRAATAAELGLSS